MSATPEQIAEGVHILTLYANAARHCALDFEYGAPGRTPNADYAAAHARSAAALDACRRMLATMERAP